jgi:hypothetical protein
LSSSGGSPSASSAAASSSSSSGTSAASTSTSTSTSGSSGCVPQPEVCNLADDDCNGLCDDLLGCRVAVDRSYASQAGWHFYTTTDSEAACCGNSVEAYGAYYLYAAAQPGLVPFYRCRTAAGPHLYTTDSTCAGNTSEGVMGYIATGPVCGSVPLYALNNASSGDNLYTLSSAEAAAAAGSGYTSQGIAGYVWPGPCGGSACTWPSPIEMVGSTLTTVTGFPTAWYGFPIPAGPQSAATLSGSISVTNAQNLYSEVLFILDYYPASAGTCVAGRWPASTPEFGPAGAGGIANFIVKAPTQGTFSLPIDLTLPGGLPVSSCVLVGLNGGPVAATQDVVSAVNLALSYSAAQPPTQGALGAGGEFCFGQNWGCQAATTDDTQSFAAITPIAQPTQLIALYGDISDSTFDGTSTFGPLPAGAWTATNDFYVYHGAECSSFGVASGVAGPGSYYAAIPADATPLLSVPLSGNGIGVVTHPVFQSLNVPLAAGDCLVTLWGLQGGGAFDNETQVSALVQP